MHIPPQHAGGLLRSNAVHSEAAFVFSGLEHWLAYRIEA
jgi:hypothetical protein